MVLIMQVLGCWLGMTVKSGDWSFDVLKIDGYRLKKEGRSTAACKSFVVQHKTGMGQRRNVTSEM